MSCARPQTMEFCPFEERYGVKHKSEDCKECIWYRELPKQKSLPKILKGQPRLIDDASKV